LACHFKPTAKSVDLTEEPARSSTTARRTSPRQSSGGQRIVVSKDDRVLGVVHLKDIVKGGIVERFAELRRMGIRTVMITGRSLSPGTIRRARCPFCGRRRKFTWSAPGRRLGQTRSWPSISHLRRSQPPDSGDGPATSPFTH
jgi:K+-transporting ATPase ATPase B chain